MKIAFISTKNAVRSIIAEAVAKKLSKLALISPEIYSCGVEPAKEVPAEVNKVLQERGYHTHDLKPKALYDIPYEEIDVLITVSPEARDACPYSMSHKRREHWVVEEPKTLQREDLIKVVEQIEELVKKLFKIS